MKNVFRVRDHQGSSLVVLEDSAEAQHLADCAGGTVQPIQVCESLEEYVVALTRETTIAEEINLRKSLRLPCDTDQILTRRSRDQAIGVAVQRAEATVDLDEVETAEGGTGHELPAE